MIQNLRGYYFIPPMIQLLLLDLPQPDKLRARLLVTIRDLSQHSFAPHFSLLTSTTFDSCCFPPMIHNLRGYHFIPPMIQLLLLDLPQPELRRPPLTAEAATFLERTSKLSL